MDEIARRANIAADLSCCAAVVPHFRDTERGRRWLKFFQKPSALASLQPISINALLRRGAEQPSRAISGSPHRYLTSQGNAMPVVRIVDRA